MVKKEDFREFKLDWESFVRGCARWNRMPKTSNHNVFSDPTESPEKTLCGFVAEEFIYNVLMPEIVPSTGEDVFQWDYRIGNDTFDIKNKCVDSETYPKYDCSIYAYHIPDCTHFMFTRMRKSHTRNEIDLKLSDTISGDKAEEYSNKLLIKYPTIQLLGYIDKKSYLTKKDNGGYGFSLRPGDLLGNGNEARGSTENLLIQYLNTIQPLLNLYGKK